MVVVRGKGLLYAHQPCPRPVAAGMDLLRHLLTESVKDASGNAVERRLLDILCCPATRQPLAPATDRQVDAINRAIAATGVTRNDGTPQASPLSAALVTRDRRFVYRIDDGIPVLLADEGINTNQVTDFPE